MFPELPSLNCGQTIASLDALRAKGGREGALQTLQTSGLLVIDDDRVQLSLARMVCARRIGIPSDRLHCELVASDSTVSVVVARVRATVCAAIDMGSPLSVFATDFHVGRGFTGLDLVKQLDESFRDSAYREAWARMGRVLLSAQAVDDDLSAVGQSGLFDVFVRKPCQSAEFQEALVNSILLRGRFA